MTLIIYESPAMTKIHKLTFTNLTRLLLKGFHKTLKFMHVSNFCAMGILYAFMIFINDTEITSYCHENFFTAQDMTI